MGEPIVKGKWNNIGVDYQLEIITYAAACLSENKTVENFQIYTNQDVPGFDDIIVKVKYASEKKHFVYLGQIREYDKDKVYFRSGKDQLRKYMEQISEIYKNRQPGTFLYSLLQDVYNENIEFWYICNSFLSNYNCSSTDPLDNPIYLDQYTKCYLKPATEYQSIFPLQDGATCYKWITKGRQPLPLDLRKFYVFLKQPKHNKVADSIAKLYPNNMSAKIAEEMVNFVKRYLELGKSAMLTKHVFETHLLYLRLHFSNFTVPPKEAIPINRDHAENWNKFVMKFDVTLASSEMQGYIFGCLHQNIIKLYDLQFNWEEVTSFSKEIVNRISSKLKILIEQKNGIKHVIRTPDTIYDLLIELWKCNYLPLVLNTDTDVTLLDKYKHLGKKFVILHRKEELYQKLSPFGLKIFANVANIPESDLSKEFLESLFISLQGREPINLFSIINDDKDLMKEMKCDQLLSLIQDTNYLLPDRSSLGQTSNISETSNEIRMDDVEHNDNGNLTPSESSEEGFRPVTIKDENGNYFYIKEDKVIPVIGKCFSKKKIYIDRNLREPTVEETVFDSEYKIICLLTGDLSSTNWKKRNYFKFDNASIDNIVSRIEFQIERKQSAFIGIKDEVVEELWSRFILTEHPLLYIKVENGMMVLLRYRNCPDISPHISYREPTINEESSFGETSTGITVITGESGSGKTIKEESFFEETSTGIIVLTGEPGSGKTTLLRSLFNACNKDCFALFCDLNDYRNDLNDCNLPLYDDPIKFILTKEEKQSSRSFKHHIEFLCRLLEKSEKIILFIDSFDEVFLECRVGVLDLIEALNRPNHRLIIASRLFAVDISCNWCDVKILKIDSLSTIDIETYLNKKNIPKDEFKKYPAEFLKNPLHINFLVKLYKDSVRLSATTQPALYKAIIKKQYAECYDICKQLALIAIFDYTVANKLGLDRKKLRNILRDVDEKKLSLIFQRNNKRPIFSHRTIAEFLVTEWLSETIDNDGGKNIRMLLKGENKHIIYLLNDIFCRNLALHQAILQKKLFAVKHLCSESDKYLKQVDKLNRTALDTAALSCLCLELDILNCQILEEIAHQMLEKGIDFNESRSPTNWRWTDYLDFVEFLNYVKLFELNVGSIVKMYFVYKGKIEEGINWSIETYHLDTAMALLKNKVDLLPKYFNEFILKVIEKMRMDLLRELIELQNSNNLEFNILRESCKNSPTNNLFEYKNLKIKGGFTAMHIACMYGSVDVVKELVRSGVEVNAVDDFQLRPLYYAVIKGSTEIVTILANLYEEEEHLPSSSSSQKIFPNYLHNSLIQNNLEITEILLNNGFDINAINENNDTALHIAVERNDENSIEKINVLRGANCNIQNFFGKTPLHIAVENERLDITEMLLNLGADTSIKCKREDTPLDLANKTRNNELVNLMERPIIIMTKLM